MPSFKIRGASNPANPPVRWDQINSGQVLKQARRIYFNYVEQCPAGVEPIGIVLESRGGLGRVVFEPPVLLPEEQFVPMELLRGRNAGRARSIRGPQRG